MRAQHMNTAGQVRGHASLMWPAKPSPGVPFVGLPLYDSPNVHECVHHRVTRLSLRRWSHCTSFQ